MAPLIFIDQWYRRPMFSKASETSASGHYACTFLRSGSPGKLPTIPAAAHYWGRRSPVPARYPRPWGSPDCGSGADFICQSAIHGDATAESNSLLRPASIAKMYRQSDCKPRESVLDHGDNLMPPRLSSSVDPSANGLKTSVQSKPSTFPPKLFSKTSTAQIPRLYHAKSTWRTAYLALPTSNCMLRPGPILLRCQLRFLRLVYTIGNARPTMIAKIRSWQSLQIRFFSERSIP